MRIAHSCSKLLIKSSTNTYSVTGAIKEYGDFEDAITAEEFFVVRELHKLFYFQNAFLHLLTLRNFYDITHFAGK